MQEAWQVQWFFLPLQRKKWEVALTLSEERGHSREGNSLNWSLGSLFNPLGKETMACKEQMAISQVCQVLSLQIAVWWQWWQQVRNKLFPELLPEVVSCQEAGSTPQVLPFCTLASRLLLTYLQKSHSVSSGIFYRLHRASTDSVEKGTAQSCEYWAFVSTCVRVHIQCHIWMQCNITFSFHCECVDFFPCE